MAAGNVPKATGSNQTGEPASKSIARHGAIYFFGNILNRAAAFLLLPLYLFEFTAAEFGIYAILQTVVTTTTAIVGLSLGWPVIQQLADQSNTRIQGRIIGSALLVFAVLACLALVVCLPVGALLDIAFVRLDAGPGGFQLAILAAVGSAFFRLGIDVLQAWRRSISFAVFSIVKTLVLVATNLYCLYVLDWGVNGVIFSTFITTAFCGLATFIIIIREIPVTASRKRAWRMAKLGAGLTPGTLIDNHMTTFDKVIAGLIMGPEIVGFLALAERINYLVRVGVVSPFIRIWSVERLAAERKRIRVAQFDYFPFLFVLLIVALLLMLSTTLSGEIIAIISDDEHLPAQVFFGFMAAAVLFYTLSFEYELGLIGQEKTKNITKIAAVCAVSATITYWIGGELFGAFGIAFSVSMAFALRAGLTLIAASRASNLSKSEPIRLYLGICAATLLGLAIASVIAMSYDPFDGLGLKILVILIYVSLLVVIAKATLRTKLAELLRKH